MRKLKELTNKPYASYKLNCALYYNYVIVVLYFPRVTIK